MEKKKIEVQVHRETSIVFRELVDEDLTNEQIIDLVKTKIVDAPNHPHYPTVHYTVTKPVKQIDISKTKPDGSMKRLADLIRLKEEERLQKSSEKTEGTSYYNCNVMAQINLLVEELSSLSEREIAIASNVLFRKAMDKHREKENKDK